MTTKLKNALCVACFSSGRHLNLLNDQETKQMFIDILDNFEVTTHTILLCYECLGRLKNGIRFRKQVQQAHQYLTGYLHNSHPTSLSRLEITKTEIHEWKPDQAISKLDFLPNVSEKEITIKLDNSHRDSDNEVSNYTDTFNFDSDNSTYKIKKSKIYHKKLKLKHDFTIHVLNPKDKNDMREIKIENVSNLNENAVNIKEEPIDIASKEQCEIKYVRSSVTKCEFSDSDDEPLKAKNAKKKKSKKEVKEKPAGVVSDVWVQRKLQQLNVPPGQLEMVMLSWDEVELERQKSLTNTSYTRNEFRCTLCVLGFNHRFKLESHMKKHAPEAGDLECSVCKTRFRTEAALLCHRRRHRSRWRCVVCLSTYSRAPVAADHVARVHGAPTPTHTCHVCGETFTSLGKLRVHLKEHAERQHCEQCGKTFKDKSSLKTHLYIHTNQKDFSCTVCDKKFRFKKALEIHAIRHQASELIYCTDCDMNFKNRLSFYQHMKYSMKHIDPEKIKYVCEFCSRRFSQPTRLQEHRDSMHLNKTPHRCTEDSCSFASASRPALRTHIRMVHHNKRLVRNHVCHTCGKAYTTKKILEGHIRSHTGERPFVCSKCPATFSHSAALYNHNKLVHKIPFVRRKKPIAPVEPVTWSIAPDHALKVTNDIVVSSESAVG